MPEHALHRWPRLRRFAWPFTIGLLFALAVMVVTFGLIALDLRDDLTAAEQRLTGVEARQVAQDVASRTAEVATCYASARGRPVLSELLRVVASGASTAQDREIVNRAINQYVNAARTEAECDALAKARGLNPEDFPPPPVREQNGRIP